MESFGNYTDRNNQYRRYINSHKCERVDEFKDSLFSEVYYEASKNVRRVLEVNNNLSLDTREDIEKFCNENYVANVISFLGERGMGKSSAMLSYAYFLKTYDNRDKDKYERFAVTGDDDCRFYVLPKIDATMLSGQESLMDILLSKMWDTFYEKINKEDFRNKDYIYTQEQFEQTKQAYSMYWKEQEAATKIQKYSSLAELHDLSQSINLRECMAGLVHQYLRSMTEDRDHSYLVITIDDLDLVQKDAFNKIDNIRLFLTVPKVIVLVTADINRLAMNFSAIFTKQLLCSYNIRENEKEHMRNYADEYLGKVFPRNMRIYMPFNTSLIMHNIIHDYEDLFRSIYKDVKDTLTENRLGFSLIAKNTNITMFPDAYSYLTKSRNLRDLINSLDEFIYINKIESGSVYTYRWMNKELTISLRNVKDDEMISYINELAGITGREFSEYLIKFGMKKYSSDMENHDLGGALGYGAAIYVISVMVEEVVLDPEIARQIIWRYSMLISRYLEEKDFEELRLILRKDIFSPALKSSSDFYLTSVNDNLIVIVYLELFLEEKEYESLNSFLEEAQEYFIEEFWKLFLCDMSQVCTQLENAKADIRDIDQGVDIGTAALSEESDSKGYKEYTWKLDTPITDLSIDYMFYNLIHLDEHWDQYFENLCNTAFPKLTISDGDKGNLKKEFEQKLGIDMEKYKEWKKGYHIENIWDLIPFQNVGSMVVIVNRIMKIGTVDNLLISDYLLSMLGIMKETFKEAEDYCQMKNLQKAVTRYSCIYEDLIEILKGLPDVNTWEFQDYYNNIYDYEPTK